MTRQIVSLTFIAFMISSQTVFAMDRPNPGASRYGMAYLVSGSSSIFGILLAVYANLQDCFESNNPFYYNSDEAFSTYVVHDIDGAHITTLPNPTFMEQLSELDEILEKDWLVVSKERCKAFQVKQVKQAQFADLRVVLGNWLGLALHQHKICVQNPSENRKNPFKEAIRMIEGILRHLDQEPDRRQFFYICLDKNSNVQCIASLSAYRSSAFNHLQFYFKKLILSVNSKEVQNHLFRNHIYVRLLVTHPNNLQSKLNKNRIPGSASSIFAHLLDMGKEEGNSYIRLQSDPGARKFYSKIGFGCSKKNSMYFELPISRVAKLRSFDELFISEEPDSESEESFDEAIEGNILPEAKDTPSFDEADDAAQEGPFDCRLM